MIYFIKQLIKRIRSKFFHSIIKTLIKEFKNTPNEQFNHSFDLIPKIKIKTEQTGYDMFVITYRFLDNSYGGVTFLNKKIIKIVQCDGKNI